jgi:hypothetical protein
MAVALWAAIVPIDRDVTVMIVMCQKGGDPANQNSRSFRRDPAGGTAFSAFYHAKSISRNSRPWPFRSHINRLLAFPAGIRAGHC